MSTDNKMKEQIGKRINAAILHANVQFKDLAEYMGVKDNVISYFVHGKRAPNHKQLVLIADYTGVSTDYLLGRVDTMNKDLNIQSACKMLRINDDTLRAITMLRAVRKNKDDSYSLYEIDDPADGSSYLDRLLRAFCIELFLHYDEKKEPVCLLDSLIDYEKYQTILSESENRFRSLDESDLKGKLREIALQKGVIPMFKASRFEIKEIFSKIADNVMDHKLAEKTRERFIDTAKDLIQYKEIDKYYQSMQANAVVKEDN